MPRKNPSCRWFFKDWENDEALRLCSMAAQGLWMRLLCIMAENDGYLLLNGRHPTVTELSRYIGCSRQHTYFLVKALETNGVFSRNEHDVIFNRRMVRENGPNGAENADPSRAHVARAPAQATRPRPQRDAHALLSSMLTLDSPKSPPSGDFDKIDKPKRKPNPRALGTNPRALGTNPRAQTEFNHNGVSEHRPAAAPLRDPVEIAISLGLRDPNGKLQP